MAATVELDPRRPDRENATAFRRLSRALIRQALAAGVPDYAIVEALRVVQAEEVPRPNGASPYVADDQSR